MNALLILTATAALGIDVTYQPLPSGGVEYIIQIEPQLLAQLAQGKPIMSDVPAGLDIRRYRIMVGTTPLPPPSSRGDGRPVMQPEEPAESRPHMHLDERDPSRPVMREEASTVPASSTQGFPREAPPREDRYQPPQQPFDRRPLGVTAESQQSRPLLAPELEAAPVSQPQPDPQPQYNVAGPRYAREASPTMPPPAVETASRPMEGPPRTNSRSFEASPQPQPASLFGPRPAYGEQPTNDQRPIMAAGGSSTQTNKPQLNDQEVAALLEAQRSSTPFWVALFGLFCSTGGNVYLGWMTWSARMKYHNLVQKFRSQPAAA